MAGRQDYEGAPIEGLSGNVAGSSDSDYGSQASFSSADYGEDQRQGGGSPAPGMSQAQFQQAMGMSRQNPFGQTPTTGFFQGIADFFAGGKGKGRVDYSNILNANQADRVMQQQYNAYRNPQNLPSEPGYDPRQRTATQPGEVTRGGRTEFGTFFGPMEEVYREQTGPEMAARAGIGLLNPVAGIVGSQLGTTERYLTDYVTDEMRNRGPQNVLQQGISALTGGADVQKAASTAANMAERLQSFFKGPSEKATAPQASNMMPGPRATEIDAMAQDPANMTATAPRPMAQTVASPAYQGGPTYDEIMPQTVNISGPTSIPEAIAIARANEGSAMGPYQTVDMATPTSRPTRNAPNFGMAPTQEEVGFVQFPELANAANVGLSPARPGEEVSIQDIFPELRNAPNVGYDRDFGPRTVDDLRSMGIEPTAQDLMDMQLSPAEFLQESQRLRENQPVRQSGDVSVAQIVPGSAFERATGVNLPRGRSVDLETMQVIRDRDGRIEGDVRALMRNKGMTFQELISLPGLRSSFAPDNTTG